LPLAAASLRWPPISIRPSSCRRSNRSHLKQREWGVAAPRANALLLPVQDTVLATIRVQVNPPVVGESKGLRTARPPRLRTWA
jgi:hypothetical protein